MKKQIWHIEVEYKWRNVRVVKGIEKPAKPAAKPAAKKAVKKAAKVTKK